MALEIVSKFSLLQHVRNWLNDNERIIAKYIVQMCDNHQKTDEKSDCLNNLYDEVILKSLLLSAAFHDLGYPLSYFMRTAEQIQRVLPYYSTVYHADKSHFQQIKAILCNSLLFRSVPIKDIEEKYNSNDHGVLSAICFLLNFYSSGVIFALSPADQCIIELSARSIYDHTNKYKDNERLTFDENPISYLLRVCDDLQEWSRVGLMIDENSNSMLHTQSFETIRKTDSGSWYGTESEPSLFYKATATKYRKMNLLDACDNVSTHFNGEKNEILIELKYNNYTLLEIAAMSFSYASYRNSELKKLQGMLKIQRYIPDIVISFDLSNNVFWLARKIVENYYVAIACDSYDSKCDDKLRELFERCKSNEARAVLNTMEQELSNALVEFNCKILVEPMAKTSVKECAGCKMLTTSEYSKYLNDSKLFLEKYIGLLGLLASATSS